MRKPVAKAWEGEHTTDFVGEIHSDLWGLAPVAMKAGKQESIITSHSWMIRHT
jgi:hypothetical protein